MLVAAAVAIALAWLLVNYKSELLSLPTRTQAALAAALIVLTLFICVRFVVFPAVPGASKRLSPESRMAFVRVLLGAARGPYNLSGGVARPQHRRLPG